jgi:hypothetical protein
MQADGEVNVYLLVFLTSEAKMISITCWPLYLQGKKPPDCTKQNLVLTLETVWMLWKREDCWKLTPDFFVIQPNSPVTIIAKYPNSNYL